MKKLAFISFAFAGTTIAQAQILLQVDLTNPDQTTITSTSNASLLTISGTGRFVRLKGLFATPHPGPFSNTFDTTGSIKPVFSARSYVYSYQSAANLELAYDDPFGQHFIAGERAFQGNMIADFTPATQHFRTSSHVGDIVVFDSNGNESATIGQYSVTAVPEPAAMTALGLGALALMRKRRVKS